LIKNRLVRNAVKPVLCAECGQSYETPLFSGTICLQLVGCGARYDELLQPSAEHAPNLECLEPRVNYGPP